MIKKILNFFGRPILVDYCFSNYKISDRQLFSLKLNLEGVVRIKLNNLQVPKREFYVVAPISGTDQILLELRSILFTKKIVLEIRPTNTLYFDTPKLQYSKSLDLLRVKNVFHKRKLRSILKKNNDFGFNTLALPSKLIGYSKSMEIKATFPQHLKLNKELISGQRKYKLKEIINQYGETNLPTT